VRTLLSLITFVLCLVASHTQAAHTQARLLLSATSAKPGDTVTAGIHLQMDPHWHTYWKNPGASGIATEIKWSLPAGITAGEIEWPAPQKLPPDDLLTYIYEGEVVLVVSLQLSPDLPAGEHSIQANVSWLECKEQCIPGSAQVSGSLKIGEAAIASADSTVLKAWRQRVPSNFAGTVAAHWEEAVSEKIRPVVLEWSATGTGPADFFPFAFEDFEVQGSVENLKAPSGKIRIRKLVKRFEGEWPQQIAGLVVEGAGGSQKAWRASISISDAAPADASATSATPGLWQMLLYAFLGGMILNIMPCVLPVIALKILGFVSESQSHPGHVRKLGLIYGLGVLCSFLVLAAIVIGFNAAGKQAGWGMQFGSGPFVVGLTILVTLVALSLFGVFEINLGSRVMGSAGTLASKQGSAGAFFNGVLATILATPCTAPFLGLALGFAFAQPPAIIVLMFLTIGAGLAFPYVLLAFQPGWLRFLPRPGAWMERFKIGMGFPTLATAVWLFSLTQAHYGNGVLWIAMFLVIVSMAAWIYGEFVQRGRQHRGLAAGVALGVLALGYAFTLESQLQWRQPAAAGNRTIEQKSGGLAWEPWSPEAVAEAQAAGRPVLVDFTADWCLTCQANKKFAIEVPSVEAKLREINGLALMGDYTLFPPAIREELRRYNRAGVPLVLVYPGTSGAQPEVLPEALTPGRVLKALESAHAKKS